MNYTGIGQLQARVFTASDALPVENAIVKISGAGENYRDIQYSLLTDVDGITKTVTLPTPSKDFSLAPGEAEFPYSVYDVEIFKDGFYTKKIHDVPIFDSIKAVLPIEMMPLIYDKDGNVVEVKNIDSTIIENPRL